METTFFQKHPLLKDILSLTIFVVAIAACTLFLNTYIYRSYNVVGSSMENTLHNDDRVIVNRAAVSWAHFLGQEYVPERGEIIVFASEDEEKVNEYRAQGITNPVTCSVPENGTNQYIITMMNIQTVLSTIPNGVFPKLMGQKNILLAKLMS